MSAETIRELLADFEGFNRGNLAEIAEAIINRLLETGGINSEKGRTGGELLRELAKYPRTNINRALRKLEALGFLDRDGRGYPYYLSLGYSKRSEERARTWRKMREEAQQ